MKPIKPFTPVVKIPPNQRTPNKASPVGTPLPNGVIPNPDKDYSKFSNMSPDEVNRLHQRDDVDKSAFSHHHTLGPKRNQASPGDHTHTGYTSRKLGYGAGLTVTGSKGGNAALASLITMLGNVISFTDTTT
jgi:hypothetical protein